MYGTCAATVNLPGEESQPHSRPYNLVFTEGSSLQTLIVYGPMTLTSNPRQKPIYVYYPLDERVPRLRHLPDSQVVHMTDLYTEQERKNSVAYNDVLARGYVQNSLNVRLDGPEDSRIVGHQ